MEDEDRPIWGAKAIGEAVGRSERQAYHLLSNGQLPATKVGNSWVTTRRLLRERIAGKAA